MMFKNFCKNCSEGGCTPCDKWLNHPNWGLVLIRIGLAVVFIAHGWAKLQNIDQTAGFFSSLGLGIFWVYLVGLVEFIGGICMLLGVMVRQVGILFAIIMLFAIILVKADKGFSKYEFDLFLLLVSLGVALLGSGKYSLGLGCCKK